MSYRRSSDGTRSACTTDRRCEWSRWTRWDILSRRMGNNLWRRMDNPRCSCRLSYAWIHVRHLYGFFTPQKRQFCLVSTQFRWVRVGGVNTTADKTRLFYLVSNCVHTVNSTRQDSFVSFASAVLTSQYEIYFQNIGRSKNSSGATNFYLGP